MFIISEAKNSIKLFSFRHHRVKAYSLGIMIYGIYADFINTCTYKNVPTYIPKSQQFSPSVSHQSNLSTSDHRGAALVLYDYYTLYADVIHVCRHTKWWSRIVYIIHCIAVALNFHRNRKIIPYNPSNDLPFFWRFWKYIFCTSSTWK